MKKHIFVFLLAIMHSVYAQSDCVSAVPLCGNADISYTPNGPGNEQEVLNGCLSTEHYSAWYTITIATSGTLTFVITPNGNSDYDWGMYGPGVNCNNRGTPIRCSYASPKNPHMYLTGMDMNSTDLSEGAGGDGFVRYLDVQAGETYYLIVDNFSANANGFSLTWGGTATLASPFSDPDVAINPFIEPGQNADGNVYLCTPTSAVDLNTFTPLILNGNPNFTATYYHSAANAHAGTNPITAPFVPTLGTDYYYALGYDDPVDPNSAAAKCKLVKTFRFLDGTFTLAEQTLIACSNYNSSVGTYDLTTIVDPVNGPFAGQNYTFEFYPTVTDANNGTNAIAATQTYTSAEGVIYLKATNEYGCTAVTPVNLTFFAKLPVLDETLTSCFIEGNVTQAEFNLENAVVTTLSGTNIEIKYFASLNDAINNTNEIGTPTAYISAGTKVYARVTNSTTTCWNIATITLVVTPPTYSAELVDKVICFENKTDLDAGAGFTAYSWSTGATTQSIQDVGVGEYWVDLTSNGCVTRQTVRVIAAPQPVISAIEITNTTATISVVGGTAPYEYSTDGITWQSSNELNGLSRGNVTIYVRDLYGCTPITTTVTVPNFINAITPNGDGINDVIDYSALRYKKNLKFVVFDRQGNKLHQADESNYYIWDGRSGNKKLPTANYWYVISWEESDGRTMNYTGWVLVKNQ